jgi:hypothetical protein
MRAAGTGFHAPIHRRQAAHRERGSETGREVLDAALARTIRDVATDPAFVETVGRAPGAIPSEPPS